MKDRVVEQGRVFGRWRCAGGDGGRRWGLWGLVAFALVGCGDGARGAGQIDGSDGDGAPANNGPNNGSNNGPNNGEGITSDDRFEGCWTGAVTDQGSRRYQCFGSPERWSCTCEGADVQSTLDGSCREALAESCDLSQAAEGYCQDDLRGACEPDDGGPDAWRCHCFAAGTVVVTEATACHEAVARACEPTCASEDGSCDYLADTDVYRCDCGHYAEARERPASDGCEGALSLACTPGSPQCAGGQGSCAEGAIGGQGVDYDCQCADGSSGQRGVEVLAGPDLCWSALVEVCGVAAGDPSMCELQTAHGDKRCSSQAGVEGRFDCRCTWRCTSSGGELGQSVEAVSCEEALNGFCPQVDTGC